MRENKYSNIDFQKFSCFSFTQEEYNKAKINDDLSCICRQCNKVVLRSKREIQKYLRIKQYDIFCSKDCHKQYKTLPRIKMKCSYCGNDIEVRQHEYKKSLSKLFFCNNSCACSYTNLHRVISEEHKRKTSETYKRKYKEQTGFSSRKEMLQKTRKCSVCGQNVCLHPKICKSRLFVDKTNLLKIGFDLSLLGTVGIYNEYFRVKEYLESLYYDKGMSILDIKTYFCIKHNNNVSKVLDFF